VAFFLVQKRGDKKRTSTTKWKKFMPTKKTSESLADYVRRRGHTENHRHNPPDGKHLDATCWHSELPAALKMTAARSYLGGLSVPTMHRLVQRGLLRPNKSTRHLIFLRSELDRFLKDGMT
jgi:hypothetical protein